jgi:hypothetical membrane protein
MKSHAIRHSAVSGLLLIGAGALILMGIITGEALYPAPYRTDANTISDLGGTLPPHSVVRQPSAAIFDTTMLVTGLMVVAAGYLLYRTGGRRGAAVLTVLLGAGIFLVGVFPGNTAPHPYVSLFTFTAGGLAALASSRLATGPVRHVYALLGTVALAALVAGTFLVNSTPVAALGIGGIERWVVYPVVLWMVAFGGYLTASRQARPRRRARTRGGRRSPASIVVPEPRRR